MIIGHVRGQELKLDRTTIAADSIKYLEAEFHFAGRDWDGYVKTAYFINGASKFALVLADDRITADMGLNLTAGEWEVKLSGVKGDSRITTTTERIYVREFGGTEGTLPDVTPTQAEQLLAKIGDMSALKTEAKDSLVAAINEAAKSGGGSGGGKDGTGIESITYKGEDEYGGNMTRAEALKYRAIIEQGAQALDDAAAVAVKSLYPEWASGTAYTAENGKPVGYKVRHSGRLWKLRQEHTSQAGWEPGTTGTESLWEEINESHDGTKYDPIPYNGNMALESGKYYTQGGVTYLCNRDTGIAVYQPLADLVGVYVEEVAA